MHSAADCTDCKLGVNSFGTRFRGGGKRSVPNELWIPGITQFNDSFWQFTLRASGRGLKGPPPAQWPEQPVTPHPCLQQSRMFRSGRFHPKAYLVPRTIFFSSSHTMQNGHKFAEIYLKRPTTPRVFNNFFFFGFAVIKILRSVIVDRFIEILTDYGI